MNNETTLTRYRVWDLPVRLFHWINFLAVFSLIVVALVMMYKKELGITGVDAKVGLKTLHVSIGYVFVTNLAIRLLWGFVGNVYGRWRSIFPGKGFGALLRDYLASVRSGEPQAFLGHNPLGRLAVSLMVLLMVTIAVTGLVRAGTDIYYPPFGGAVTEFVAAEGSDPAALIPYDKTGTDAAKMAELKAFKSPFGLMHTYAAYALMAVILLHISFVVRAEVKERDGLVSAMFSGEKVMDRRPEDLG